MTTEEIDFVIEQDSHGFDQLMADIDNVLISNRDQVGTIDDQVVPIGYGQWNTDNLSNLDCLPLTLFHRQIAIPLSPLREPRLSNYEPDRDYNSEVQKYINLLAREQIFWLQEHAPLIRVGAIIPFSPMLCEEPLRIEPQISSKKNRKFSSTVDLDILDITLDDIAPIVAKRLPKNEAKEMMRHGLDDLYYKFESVKRMKMKPAICDRYTWNLWNSVNRSYTLPAIEDKYGIRLSSTLAQIDIPNLRSLPLTEIAALHQCSDSFSKWRERMALVSRSIMQRIECGGCVNSILSEELLPLRELVEQIDKDVSSSRIARYLSKPGQSILMGVSVGIFHESIMRLLYNQSVLEQELIKVGSKGAILFLASLLLPSKAQNGNPISSLYHAIF